MASQKSKNNKKIMALVNEGKLTPEEAWDHTACSYSQKIQNEYHQHRLKVIDAIMPRELYNKGNHIFDFGCGDAVHFDQFLRKGCEISGCDISQKMVNIGQKHLEESGYNKKLVKLGGVHSLAELQSDSYDAILSFNVLAYLNDKDEVEFYKQAGRLLKSGGYLILSHSNELFDLYSMNQYTAEFYKKHLIIDPQKKPLAYTLLSSATKEGKINTFNIRENPLAYKFKLKSYGFIETNQEFINLHSAPPPIMSEPKNYPDTLCLPEAERWKLMFLCSTFVSLSVKE